MKFAPLLGLLLPSILMADCRYHNGVSFVTLPEGRKVSLFDEGKSLASHTIQDQDGLGTCYANASSVMLKSILPGSPDISYIHAAVAAGSKGWVANYRLNGAYHSDKYGSFVDGGYICETVAALKKEGGACPVSFSIAENKTLLDPHVQMRLFKGLGKYFDALNKIKPKDRKALSKELNLALEIIKNEQTAIVDQCREEQKDPLPVSQAIGDFLANELFSLDDSKCSQRKRGQLMALMKAQSQVTSDKAVIFPKDEVARKFQDLIKLDEGMQDTIMEYLGNKDSVSPDKIDAVNAFLTPKLTELLHSFVPQECEEKETGGKTPREVDRQSAGLIFISQMEQQYQGPCQYLLNQTVQLKDSERQCSASPELDNLYAALAPLIEIGVTIDGEILKSLKTPHDQSASQLNDILFPGCKRRSLIPLNNVSCTTFNMCDQSILDARRENPFYSGVPGTCYRPERAMAEMRLRVINNVAANRAVGISVCTSFMKDPSNKTNFCKNRPEGVPNHDFHAMAVTGYRCIGDKIEYQLLNSWGASHCPEAAEVSNQVKCDGDADGNNTGKFWVPEEVLVDSTTGITQVSIQNPQAPREKRK